MCIVGSPFSLTGIDKPMDDIILCCVTRPAIEPAAESKMDLVRFDLIPKLNTFFIFCSAVNTILFKTTIYKEKVCESNCERITGI